MGGHKGIWIAAFFPFVLTLPAGAGECRIDALTIASDAPGFSPIQIGLVVDSKSRKITHLEFKSASDKSGKLARVSANLVETLSEVMNREMIQERISFEIDRPTEGIQQIRAQFGGGKFDLDVNPDWLPTFNDVFKVSGSFSPQVGAKVSVDAQRGLNPFRPRAKLKLTLERHGPSCRDWKFYAVDGSRSLPVSGIVLKMNRIGEAIVGVEEIVPIGVDPGAIQKLVEQSLQPASHLKDAMVSERSEKSLVPSEPRGPGRGLRSSGSQPSAGSALSAR